MRPIHRVRQSAMYDTLTTQLHVLRARCTVRRTCGCRASAASSSCRARTIRPSTASSSRAAAAASIPGSSRTTSSTGRRSALAGLDAVREPDDLARRGARGELGELAAPRIKAGEWPWSFFCWPEERPRPVYPSAFQLLAPAVDRRPRRARGALPGLRQGVGQPRLARARRRAVRERPRGGGGASTCSRDDASATLEEFQAELWSGSFDARRLGLE